MSALFELRDLTVPGIVNHLNLSFQQGQVVLLRTSEEQEIKQLLQVIIGELRPETGAVLLDEVPIHELDREQLLKFRRDIGTVTAQAGLISNLKVWENITLPLLYQHGSFPDEAAERSQLLLEKLGYKGNMWALPGHLSQAERIMIAFVRAAVSSPLLMVYAECLDVLQNQQRDLLLQQAMALQSQANAPAALFITTGGLQLPLLVPDITCDLRFNPPQITRQP